MAVGAGPNTAGIPVGSPPGTVGAMSDGRVAIVGPDGKIVVQEAGKPPPVAGQTQYQYLGQNHPNLGPGLQDPNYVPPVGDPGKTLADAVAGAPAAIGAAITPAKVDTTAIAAQAAKENAIADDLKAQADAAKSAAPTVAPSVGPVPDYVAPAAQAGSLRGGYVGGGTVAPAPAPAPGTVPTSPAPAPAPAAGNPAAVTGTNATKLNAITGALNNPVSPEAAAAIKAAQAGAGAVASGTGAGVTNAAVLAGGGTAAGKVVAGALPALTAKPPAAPGTAPAAGAPAVPAQGPAEPQGAGFGGTSVIQGPGEIKAGQAAAPVFNAAQPNESRGAFVDSLAMARDAANGTGPSGASIQAGLDIDRATKQANALAASRQGRSVGGALVAAEQSASNSAINIDAQAQAAKAREMEAARGQLIAGTGQLSGLDVNRELGLTELGTRTDIANAGNVNQANIAGAGLNLEAQKANQAIDYEARALTARLGTDVSISNADRDARTQVIVKDLQLRAAQGDQDAILKMKGLDDARAANDTDAYIRALAIASNTSLGKATVEQQGVASTNQYKGAIIGGIASVIPAIV